MFRQISRSTRGCPHARYGCWGSDGSGWAGLTRLGRRLDRGEGHRDAAERLLAAQCDLRLGVVAEALTEAARYAQRGMKVWAIPYDYANANSEGPSVSLGVPYFTWGPAYVRNIRAAMNGTWSSHFEWNGPDWANINNPNKSAVGFNKGSVLSPAAAAGVDRFVSELAQGLNLWKGPINLQDGTPYLTAGQTATEQQIWYLPKLLQGMQGQSVSK